MKINRIYVEITNICNLNCSFCAKSKKKKKSLTIEEFKHIIEEIKPVTDTIYLHLKGEPLLSPILDDILNVTDQNGIKVKITTNGTLLNEKKEILKQHFSLKQINVSLHCEQNQKNYFENVFSVCEELSSKICIVYRIWTMENNTISKKNHIIVDKISSHYKISTTDVENSNNITLKDRIYLNKDNLFIWPSLELKEENHFGTCYGTKTHIGILADGTVVPCCLDQEGKINLGNIFETSLQEILKSKRFLELKSSLQKQILNETLCQKCPYINKFKA